MLLIERKLKRRGYFVSDLRRPYYPTSFVTVQDNIVLEKIWFVCSIVVTDFGTFSTVSAFYSNKGLVTQLL